MIESWAEKYLTSQTDKCWFCGGDGCDEFDMEWDTFLHIKCLKERLRSNPRDLEARLMIYLLEALKDPEYEEIKELVDAVEDDMIDLGFADGEPWEPGYNICLLCFEKEEDCKCTEDNNFAPVPQPKLPE